jgi:hypothetical protein
VQILSLNLDEAEHGPTFGQFDYDINNDRYSFSTLLLDFFRKELANELATGLEQ